MRTEDYTGKFNNFPNLKLYHALNIQLKAWIKDLCFRYTFTFQEFRQVVEIGRDLAMWREKELPEVWRELESKMSSRETSLKKNLLQKLNQHVQSLKQGAKTYPAEGLPKPSYRETHKIEEKKSEKKICGMCPVASPKTVCCNLLTIDAVENCAFGCSYCTIQTFYTDKIIFDSNFKEKIESISSSIDPNRFYHFGTGQSSDSLIWGNRHQTLEILCEFARRHPNILLELKTKSDNVDFFFNYSIPKNVVCSWSLNPPTIIQNEEHFTASLDRRLAAARQVANRGIKVAFHFHPMVYYQGWNSEYVGVAQQVQKQFHPDEVLFLSMGTLTFIKPVVQKIRQMGNSSKILEMEMVSDPNGKLTYPNEIKIEMFQQLYHEFSAWKDQVFLYLCMEKEEIWKEVLGWTYPSNESFEKDFGKQVMEKIS